MGWWSRRTLQPPFSSFSERGPRVDADGGVEGTWAIAYTAMPTTGLPSEDLVVATTRDGGCSWRSTRRAGTARWPDVAVSHAAGVVAVSFVRDDGLAVVVSLDGGSTFAPPVMISAAVDAETRPRIALARTDAAIHLHVAWTAAGALHVASSRATGAAGTWTEDLGLSSRLAGLSGWTEIEVTADTRSTDPSTESAVSLLATAVAAGSLQPAAWFMRSNDSGATFWGDPSDPTSRDRPVRVSDAPPVGSPFHGGFGVQLDVSDDGTGEFYSWQLALYSDLPLSGSARADARAEEGVVPSVIADWNLDPPADPLALESASAAAVSIIPNPLQRPPSPEAYIFVQALQDELFVVRVNLDAATAGSIERTCDPVHLSNFPSQSRPRHGTVSADEDLSHVVVAWRIPPTDPLGLPPDGGRIAWMRTDTWTAPPTAVSASPADCGAGGGLDVSWRLPPSPPHCDIARVRVSFSPTPDPVDGTTVMLDRAATSTHVTGLLPDTQYFVIVTVVDEACNEASAAAVTATTGPCVAPRCPHPVGHSLRAARRPTRDDVQLTWLPPPADSTHDAATGYDTYRSTTRADRGFSLVAGDAPGTTFVDSGAARAGEAPLHFYLVVARNACGTSGDEPLP